MCHRSLQDMDCPHVLYLRPSFMCLYGLSSFPGPTTEFYVLKWIVHLSCTYDWILCAYMDCPPFLYLRQSFMCLHGLSTFPVPTTEFYVLTPTLVPRCWLAFSTTAAYGSGQGLQCLNEHWNQNREQRARGSRSFSLMVVWRLSSPTCLKNNKKNKKKRRRRRRSRGTDAPWQLACVWRWTEPAH